MSFEAEERRQKMTELLLEAFPNGITTTGLAEQLGITRQQALKDIRRLQETGVDVEEVEGRTGYVIDPRRHILPLRLNQTQAWMLYLAMRRLVRAQMDRQPAVRGLLVRLTGALMPEIADRLANGPASESNHMGDEFRILTDGWREDRCVEISYKPLNRALSRHLIAPYWFEPAVWSDSTYVIAGIVLRDGIQLATLKLERIQSARITGTAFDRPDPDLVLERLQDTWGIWMSEEPQQVRLKFHNRQWQRLKESRWHPSERLTEMDDGSILWEALVAEPQEMMPWIRGWGPDVEVLTPEPLRQAIARDAERTAHLYGVTLDDSYF